MPIGPDERAIRALHSTWIEAVNAGVPAAADPLWRAAGVHRAHHNAFYCGTGWRASLAFFYAWVMGWERISVYDGGWYEWSSDPANPVAINPAAPPRCGTQAPSGPAPSAHRP